MTPAALIARAEEAFGRRDLATARTSLEEALPTLEDGPLRAEVLADLAVIEWTEQRVVEAGARAAQALELEPDNASALEVLDQCTRAREIAAATHIDRLRDQRMAEFGAMWTCIRLSGRPMIAQATLMVGRGRITLGEEVQFGVVASPGFLSGYGYVEARTPGSHIRIGDGTVFNNSCSLVAEGEGITIGRGCLFGVDVSIGDSDGHDLHPDRRVAGTPETAPVRIGDNVFVGNGVRIVKGVTIGDDTVVGAGSIVTADLPAGVIAAGIPARPLREVPRD